MITPSQPRLVAGQSFPYPMPKPAQTRPMEGMQYMRRAGSSLNIDGVNLKLHTGTGDLALEDAASGWIVGKDFDAAVSATSAALDSVRSKDIRSLAILQSKQGQLLFAPVFATTDKDPFYRAFEVDSDSRIKPGDASIKALVGERGWVDLR